MISVNDSSLVLVEDLIENAERYKIKVGRILDSWVLDCGVETDGSWEAGRIVSEILIGGLNPVEFTVFPERINDTYYQAVNVKSDHVVLQQAGCNISGWELRPGKYAPVLAGPGRTVARREGDWFSSYSDYQDDSEYAIITVEQGELLTEEDVKDLQEATGVAKDKLYIIVVASGSLVCSIQVAARIIEQTLHRLHEEGFNLEQIIEASGFCVIPPVVKDDLLAMGRLNDVLLYGGQATFTVDCEDEEIEAVIEKITSDKSSAYGRVFSDIYAEHGYDFYQVPMEIYSPAKVQIINRKTGHSFTAGEFNLKMLEESFTRGVK